MTENKIVRYDKAHESLQRNLDMMVQRIDSLDPTVDGVEFAIQQMAVMAAKARDLAHDRRAREMAPFETPLKEVKARWAPVIDGFDSCVTRLKKAASFVLTRQREERDKQRQAAEARLAAARAEEKRIDQMRSAAATQPSNALDHKGALSELRAAREAVDALSPPGAPIGVKSESGSLSGRGVWKWSTEDITKVPDIYVQRLVDPSKVDLAVKNGIREIPGIRIYQETVMSVRVKR